MIAAAKGSLLLISIWLVVVLLSACGVGAEEVADGDSGGEAARPSASGALTGELRVFAAASLTDAFEELERRFEARYPGVDVLLNLAGSNRLTAQLLEGAEADVFASADQAQMEAVVEAGVASSPQIFAENDLQIAVEPGNPHGIDGLSDLAGDDLVVVLPSEAVPAGAYASRALARAAVTLEPASYELDVRAALSKVVLGEADAAIVYRSDVATHGGAVDGVEIAEAVNVTARYPIAVIAGATNRPGADAFVEFVRSDVGQQVLRDAGFAAS